MPSWRACCPRPGGRCGQKQNDWAPLHVFFTLTRCNAAVLAPEEPASALPSHTLSHAVAMAAAALCSAAPCATASLRTARSGAEAAKPLAAARGSLRPPLRLPRGLSVFAQANKVSVRSAGARWRAVVVEPPLRERQRRQAAR